MVAVKPKKAKKEKKEPSEKRQSTGGKVTDKKALEERMAADGWTKEEKKREGSDHVDKYWLDPKGGKKCRSIVEVARKAYPEFLSEAAKAAPTKKKPAAQKKKKPEPQAGPLAASHVGAFTSIRIVSGSDGFEAVRAQVQEAGRSFSTIGHREANSVRHRDPHALHVLPDVLLREGAGPGPAGRERRRRRVVEVQGELGGRPDGHGQSMAAR